MKDTIKYLFKWFLVNILLVLFILFLLEGLFGLEFNEYPHQEFKTQGNSTITFFGEHTFCVIWGYENYKNVLSEIKYGFYSNSCFETWNNPSENRVMYNFGYETILNDFEDSNREVSIEMVEKQRAFILFQGKQII